MISVAPVDKSSTSNVALCNKKKLDLASMCICLMKGSQKMFLIPFFFFKQSCQHDDGYVIWLYEINICNVKSKLFFPPEQFLYP